jgi:transposase
VPRQQAERREAPERQDDRGNVWLKAVLAEVTWANARRKTGYLGAQFRRLARRRGLYKALVAVAHSVLVIIYHVLRERQPYSDLGADYFEKLDTQRLEQLHVRRLNALGYSVTLTPLPPAEPVPA